MSLHKEPFSWEDDPAESPVPLGDGTSDDMPGLTYDIAQEAEVVVRQAQDSLARVDTDPAIPLRLLAAAAAGNRWAAVGHMGGRLADSGRRARRLRTVLVIAACLAALAHGWHEGSESLDPQAAGQSSVHRQSLMRPHHGPMKSATETEGR